MEIQECMMLLRKYPAFWSRLGMAYHPPRRDENGKFIVMSEFDSCSQTHRDMTEAGVRTHTSILFSGWVGPDEYDYTRTDQTLGALFKNNPDIWYIPRIQLDAPVPWCQEHPEDVAVYFNGPASVAEVRNIIGTLKHDLLGFESPYGNSNFAFKDDRPNINGVIGMQSFSSERWLKDAGKALQKLIAHLENGPYGKRIMAYHVGYGICGETNCHGVIKADHSIQNRKLFFQWALKKYKSLKALREAWAEPELSGETCSVPSPELRENRAENLAQFFRATPQYAKCIDYDIFLNENNADAIEHLCRAIKKSVNKAAGIFFGYIFETIRSSASGYLCYEKIINSPYVDFIASPKSYYRCGPGEPGGVQAVAQSFSRKKLYLDEMDIRLHTAKTTAPQCKDITETRYVLWREFAKNQQYKSGFWWMDLGGDWYTDIETRRETNKIVELSRSLDSYNAKSAAENLIVADEKEAYYRTSNTTFHRLIMQRMSREIAHSAVPFDIYRLADLKTLDLSAYKMVCFLNTFVISDADMKVIKERINPGALLLYNYAFGVRDPDYDLANIERRTGFKLVEKAKSPNIAIRPEPDGIFASTADINSANLEEDHQPNFPFLEIIPCGKDEIAARYADGGVAVALRSGSGRKEVFSAMPLLGTEHFKILAGLAGCHIYSGEKCAVYENTDFIGAFAHDDLCKEITLKFQGDFFDCVNGQKFPRAKTLPLKNNFGFFQKNAINHPITRVFQGGCTAK